jgi:hypothetical protein
MQGKWYLEMFEVEAGFLNSAFDKQVLMEM